jgi:hypothetical protein
MKTQRKGKSAPMASTWWKEEEVGRVSGTAHTDERISAEGASAEEAMIHEAKVVGILCGLQRIIWGGKNTI